jgi:hypothetical protein
MSEASIRTLAWREQKRQDGYQPVTIWIPATVKNALVNLAFTRHQDLSELITEALQAWAPTKGGKTVAFTETRQVEALIDRKIKEALTPPLPQIPSLPPPAPEVDALPPPPVGWKQCRKGHKPYPATKDGCPTCGVERKRASRARLAALRLGEIPT